MDGVAFPAPARVLHVPLPPASSCRPGEAFISLSKLLQVPRADVSVGDAQEPGPCPAGVDAGAEGCTWVPAGHQVATGVRTWAPRVGVPGAPEPPAVCRPDVRPEEQEDGPLPGPSAARAAREAVATPGCRHLPGRFTQGVGHGGCGDPRSRLPGQRPEVGPGPVSSYFL